MFAFILNTNGNYTKKSQSTAIFQFYKYKTQQNPTKPNNNKNKKGRTSQTPLFKWLANRRQTLFSSLNSTNSLSTCGRTASFLTLLAL